MLLMESESGSQRGRRLCLERLGVWECAWVRLHCWDCLDLTHPTCCAELPTPGGSRLGWHIGRSPFPSTFYPFQLGQAMHHCRSEMNETFGPINTKQTTNKNFGNEHFLNTGGLLGERGGLGNGPRSWRLLVGSTKAAEDWPT